MEVKLTKKEYEELVSYKEKYEDFKEYSHTFLLNGKNWEVCGSETVVKKIEKEIKPLIEMHARLAVAEDKLSDTKQLLDDTLDVANKFESYFKEAEKTIKENNEKNVINATRIKKEHDREVFSLREECFSIKQKYKKVLYYSVWEFYKFKRKIKKQIEYDV